MANLQLALDLALALLLAATLFHAARLDRSLRALKRDRSALDTLLGTFAASTRQAEAGIDRLRGMTEATATQMARQQQLGAALKDDLTFLIERGDRLADRLEGIIRTTRPLLPDPAATQRCSPEVPPPTRPAMADPPRVRSQAERDLLHALRSTR
jgi:hypothetical protein